MVATARVSLRSAMVLLLCAIAGLTGSVEAKSRQILQADNAMRERSPLRERPAPRRCAERGQVCRDRFRRGRLGCCEDPKDECRRVRRDFVCAPKPELKADGAGCADDGECINACVSVPCGEAQRRSLLQDDSDDSDDCGGVCSELRTVDYEPDEDGRPECNHLFEDCSNGAGCCDALNNAKAECLPTFGEACEGQEEPCGMTCRPTADCLAVSPIADRDQRPRCDKEDPTICCGACETDWQCEREAGADAPSLCPSFCAPEITEMPAKVLRCPGNPKKRGQICYRGLGTQKRCNGSNRCVWDTRPIDGQVKWVGVCKRWGRPIFNC